MTEPGRDDSMCFAIEIERLQNLGLLNPNSRQALAAYDQHELTSAERLFFKLWGNNLLNSGYFEPGQAIARKGEHPAMAHIVTSGEVVARDNERTYTFGPASVFGLAEGLTDQAYRWDATANSLVTTKVIPIARALREVHGLNAGLRGICRSTAMRILDLKTPPANLR